jgi:hypothetical protein
LLNEREMNLLEPGEDPGEGYEGSPDMYPDYEEDEKDFLQLGRTSSKESYRSYSKKRWIKNPKVDPY